MMRVRIAYRNYRPIHDIFQNQINNPPEGVRYLISSAKKYPSWAFGVYRKLGHKPMIRKPIRQAQKLFFNRSQGEDYELVHSVDYIFPNYERVPFVVDIGHITSLNAFSDFTKKEAKQAKDFLLHHNCKKIIARTKASKKTIELFCKTYLLADESHQLMTKVRVVYPGLPNNFFAARPKKFPAGKIKLLLIGNDRWKGIDETIKAFTAVKSKQQKVELTIVSKEAETLEKKYNNLEGLNLLEPSFSRAKIIELLDRSQIFVMPSHVEIFGMVFIEALARGLPVIALNQYSTPEIVRDGEDGFLVRAGFKPLDECGLAHKEFTVPKRFESPDPKVVDEVAKFINNLTEDASTYHDMSKRAIQNARDRFSMDRRNKSLKEIYEKALK